MKRFLIFYVIFLAIFIHGTAYADISLDKKALRDVATMEKRHYRNPASEFDTNEYRLNRLETTLFGQTFEDETPEQRMKRLRIGSQRMMTTGAAAPLILSKRMTQSKDNLVQIVDNDNVGIIDGLMRLYAPKVYEMFKEKNERLMRSEF